jgi:hypothetical protein
MPPVPGEELARGGALEVRFAAYRRLLAVISTSSRGKLADR